MTANDISDAEIEAAARAWQVNRYERWEISPEERRGGPSAGELADIRAAILASRAALLAEGRKVVAREPTEEMVDAKTGLGSPYAHYKVWRAMWDAAP